jgi:hypothetical protein
MISSRDVEDRFCIRAWLQPCRNRCEKELGFSPWWGRRFRLPARPNGRSSHSFVSAGNGTGTRKPRNGAKEPGGRFRSRARYRRAPRAEEVGCRGDAERPGLSRRPNIGRPGQRPTPLPRRIREPCLEPPRSRHSLSVPGPEGAPTGSGQPFTVQVAHPLVHVGLVSCRIARQGAPRRNVPSVPVVPVPVVPP